MGGGPMNTEYPELDRMQLAYKAAVEEWLAAIRKEEALASGNHTSAEAIAGSRSTLTRKRRVRKLKRQRQTTKLR